MPPPFPGLPIISTTIVASPAAAAETTVAQIKVGSVADPTSALDLSGWVAFTVGTNGTAVRLRIRNGSITGTVVADSGALTGGIAAAALVAQDVEGFDTPGDVASLTYVLTVTVTAGSAASTVTAVKLRALPFG
jgi:hypothetical protein